MKKSVSVILSIIILLMCCAGCVSAHADTVPTHAVIVIGHHANAPVPNLELARQQIFDAAYSYGTVTLIVVDGDPFAAAVVDVPEQAAMLGEANYQKIATQNTEEILALAATCTAVTPEVDTLSAIRLGARSLADKSGKKVIVIIDSGLSTTGYIDFSTCSISDMDVDATIEALLETDTIPDLSGIDIIWNSLCDVAEPQTKPTSGEVNIVRSLWERVLTEGHASSVTFPDGLPVADAAEDLPYVSLVEVDEIQSVLSVKAVEEVIEEKREPIIFDERNIRFLPDSDQLADADAALAVLGGVIEYMKDNPDFSALLVGTTAKAGSLDGCIALSERRAATIYNLLVSEGVSPDQLQIIGTGFENPWYQDDSLPDGSMNEDVAPGNRSVVLVDASTPIAEALLSQQEDDA